MPARSDELVLVLTTLPDAAAAQRVAQALLDERLAACVAIGAQVTSLYRWQGTLEQATEVPLQIKTVGARLDALCTRLRALHPYDVPELILLPVQASADYLAWARDSCAEPPSGSVSGASPG